MDSQIAAGVFLQRAVQWRHASLLAWGVLAYRCRHPDRASRHVAALGLARWALDLPSSSAREAVKRQASFSTSVSRLSGDLHSNYIGVLLEREMKPWTKLLLVAQCVVILGINLAAHATEFDFRPQDMPDHGRRTLLALAANPRHHAATHKKEDTQKRSSCSSREIDRSHAPYPDQSPHAECRPGYACAKLHSGG